MYESLFTLVLSFMLRSMIKRRTNLAEKFNSQVVSISNLEPYEKGKLEIILDSDVEDLQEVLNQAYDKTYKKQFKLLADPNAREFITLNLDYIKKYYKKGKGRFLVFIYCLLF